MLEMTLPLNLCRFNASLIQSGRMAPLYPFSCMIALADYEMIQSEKCQDCIKLEEF